MDVFCKSPSDGRLFKGSVWAGPSVFPDFFHPNTTSFWAK